MKNLIIGVVGNESLHKYWCYPLMRSNVYSPHPIFAGIYHDMFYHHGSMPTRATTKGYFDHHINDHEKIEKDLYDRLRDNPRGFINHIRTGSQDQLNPL
jgi:hypothetical protein